MTLTKSIRSLVEANGLKILASPTIINILSDYNAFNDVPSSKNILKNIISEGYLEKIAFIHDNHLPMSHSAQIYFSELYHKLGLRQDGSAYVLNSIFDALGYGQLIQNISTSSEKNIPNPTGNPKPQPSLGSKLNLTSHQLDNKSESFRQKYASEAEAYLDGIITIVGHPKQELGAALSVNVSYSEFNCITVNLEIDGGITCKFQYNIEFVVVLKSQKGKILSTENTYLDKNEAKQPYIVKGLYFDEDAFRRVGDITEIKLYWKID